MNQKNKEICKIANWLIEGLENEQIPPTHPPPPPPQPPPPVAPPAYDSVIECDRLSPQIIYDSLQSLQTNSHPTSHFDFPAQSQFSTFDSRPFDSHPVNSQPFDSLPFDSSRTGANPIPTSHFQPQLSSFTNEFLTQSQHSNSQLFPQYQSQPEASFYPFVPSQSQSLPYIPQTSAINYDQFQIPQQPTFHRNGSFYDESSIGFQSYDTGF